MTATALGFRLEGLGFRVEAFGFRQTCVTATALGVCDPAQNLLFRV